MTRRSQPTRTGGRRWTRRLGLLALIFSCFALTVVLISWRSLTDLRHAHPRHVQRIEAETGTLAGVVVSVAATEAMILPEHPDRALIYLRLGLQGEATLMQGWLTCDVALTDARGRRWLPLTNRLGFEVIRVLGAGDAAGRACPQALREPATDAPALSDQAFLVPADSLDSLRVEVSGRYTLPDALSLPVRARPRLQLQ